MRVLGIDPGLRLTGYACLAPPSPAPSSFRGAPRTRAIAPPQVPVVVEAGVFRLDVKRSIADRLVELESDLGAALERLRPGLFAVEGLYAHYKHPATAIAMGHARGVILLCAARAGVPILELKPTAVKKSLTGFGHASKAQMQEGARAALNLKARPSPPDVADAMAIALAALHRRRA